MDLGLDVNETDGIPVIAVRGEVDFGTAPRLRELLVSTAMDGNPRVVVDLRAVEFLDSTGLGVLVGALKRYRTLGGDLVLVISTSRIRSVFELTGLRSEEHTSELQSPCNLVCRLLLEKKKRES